jgi:hypothetical protein
MVSCEPVGRELRVCERNYDEVFEAIEGNGEKVCFFSNYGR